MLRRELEAALLGYENFADLVLEDRMAKRGARAREFITDLTRRSEPSFHRETAELGRFKKKVEGASASALAPWDVAYYSEKQRQALYDFDEEELRPYFQLEQRGGRALRDGAQRLYGVRIKKNGALSAWHTDVGVYDITTTKTARSSRRSIRRLLPAGRKARGARG